MSVDIKHLRDCGVSASSYRKLFSQAPKNYPKRIGELVQLISQRIDDGFTANFRDWRTWAAIDYACEIPFRQTTPTMINHVLSQHLDREGTLKAMADWGLKEEDLFLKIPQPGKDPLLVPNPPVFFQIFIPIVKAYLAIREAKLFNERNGEVLLNYHPLKTTSRNQVLCEIITDLVGTISTWFGYSAVLRQAIKQTLKYGVMLAFPEEEWFCEEQERLNDEGKPETYVVKEGIRYIIPHPSRMFYDLNRPLTRINSDTGCEWMGHWFIRRYGDILDSRLFWNRDRIFAGTNWIDSPMAGNYFSEFFPCRLKFPVPYVAGPPTREDRAALYTSGNRDQAIFLTDFFIKLSPRDWDLGEYKAGKLVKTYNHPVWHRFVIAGDSTVVHAAPCAYNPCWFMGYDYDETAGKNSSLGLECIPWQDHVGNILSQIILTAKQNLANVTFYDSNVISKTDIEKLNNAGEQKYRGMYFIEYDSQQSRAAMTNVKDALFTAQLGKANVVELLQMLPMVLNMMERVLQISAQEAGAAASHQQSKEELIQTGGASTNRVVYTGSLIDEGIDAWKRQLYDGSMAYMDSSISAEVSADIPDLDQHLQELGLTVKGKGEGTLLVSGQKKALRLEGFASSAKGENPAREKEIASAMLQLIQTICGQEKLFEVVGVDTILTVLEEASHLAGVPVDVKLRAKLKGKKDEEVPEAILNAIKQAQQATIEMVVEKIAKPLHQQVGQDDQKLQGLEQIVEKLKGIYQIAAQAQDKNKLAAEKTAADIKRRDALASAQIQREQARTQADLALKKTKLEGELTIEEQRTKAQLALEGAKAMHGAHLAEKTAKAKPKA